MKRYLSLVAYVLLTVITYAVYSYEFTNGTRGAVTEHVLLLTVSASIVSRVFLIMFWFSLLPAWLLATRMRTDATRYFLLWAGYLVFFAPVWLIPWGSDGELGTLLQLLSVASTVLFAGIVTVLVRKLERKRPNEAGGVA
jgi:hypothetical protein